MPNPLFVNIGSRIPRALFSGDETAGVIDSECGIIIITKSVFESPSKQILPTFLPNGDKAVKLACCNRFVISLGESGRVYKSEISERTSPNFSEVTELSGNTIVDITYNHCFAVLNDGRVFGYGRNYNCKLGLPERKESVSTFTEIDSLKKYKIISIDFQNIRRPNDRIKNLESEIMKLKSKPKKVKETIEPIKIYTKYEIDSLDEGKRIGKGATSEVFEVFRKEKLAKKVLDAEVIQKDETDDEITLKISIEDVKRLMLE